MKINQLLPIASIVLCLSVNFGAYSGNTTPKREFRSTWFTTHVNIDWPQTKGTSATAVAKQKEDMITYIEGFERMNLNGACFQVRAQCDAVYKSSYEPWSAVLTGVRGTDPGWDPLAFCIEECHKRGLECYAWINPFRWSTGTDYNTPQDKAIKEKGWILSYGGYYVLNPAIPEAREHILKVCKEIVDNYALDGVLFDDYFYPNNIPENNTAGDWNLYKASGTSMSIGDWRRENINIFVREFQKMIEEAHPDMRFGISPAGIAGKSASKFGVSPVPSTVTSSDWQYSTIYSDPLAWLSEGSIDFISPQIYWQTYHATAPYEPLCDWWSYVAEHFGRHFYSSQNVYFFTSENNTKSWNEVAKQVELNREYAEPTTLNAPGTIYYSSKYFYGPALSGLGDHLLKTVNQTKALVPVVTWKKVPTFGAPEGLKFDGKKLTWTPIVAPKSIIRYTIYAVPQHLTMDDALESNGDGISNDYLLKVWYDTTFELPNDKQNDYWYAVCAYDGLGNEFAPAVVNYAEGESAKVELKSPTEGATIAWNQEFSWSNAEGAQYVLRFAKDSKFSDIIYTSERVTTPTIRPDFSNLLPETKYYWNVTCFEPGKLSTISETRSFITPKYGDLPKTTLVSPVDGAEVEGDITFEWNAVEGVKNYALEVSKDSDFKTLRYTVNTTETSLTVNPSYIGKGVYYWRIAASAPLTNPSVSDARSFSIASLAVGEFEPGYVVKKDAATYTSVDGVSVENLWMRANFGDFKNIEFANDGMMERSMVAIGEYVYLTRRSENSSGAALFLEKYDGLTGEHISTIELGEEARVSYFPLNTVMKDDSDNIVISNLVLNAVDTPILLHYVNPTTGELTEIARIKVSGMDKARVDHVNVRGNVLSGNFIVYLPVASDNKIIRIKYVNGEMADSKTVTLKEFYPSDKTTLTIAPFVTPISDDVVLANGGGIGLAQYDLATGVMTDNIGNSEDNVSKGTTANGSACETLGSNYYTVYPSSDHTTGFKFDIVKSPSTSLAAAKCIARVPADGLGSINSSTASTPISIVKDDNGSMRVYVYAVGNGLSAYKITDTKSGINGVNDDSDLCFEILGKEIVFNKEIGKCELFSMTGVLVQNAVNTNIINVETSGIYLMVVDGRVYRIIIK